MQKDIIDNEPYEVSISDWITILQDKTSTHTNLLIFFATMIIGMMIIVPQWARDYTNSSLSATIAIILLLGFYYFLYRLGSKRVERENKPFK